MTNVNLKNKIINGITDWVYEEEFAFVRAFEWNSDSKKIAFLRFDESLVPEFSMDVYGNRGFGASPARSSVWCSPAVDFFCVK